MAWFDPKHAGSVHKLGEQKGSPDFEEPSSLLAQVSQVRCCLMMVQHLKAKREPEAELPSCLNSLRGSRLW